MSNVYLIAMLFLISLPAHAQWEWGHPVPQGNDLWNIDFAPSSAAGWAVGAAGMILRSTDGGAHWTVQESSREDILRGVHSVTANTAWAVGDNGVVLRTTNAGYIWNTQSSGTTAGINTVFAVTANVACFVGDAGMLHTTTNGGLSWVTRSTGTTNNLNGVHFTDAQHGVAVGSSGTIRQTSNGGASWTPRSVSPGSLFADLIDVYFVDTQYGWAVGTGGTVVRSTDGGGSWSRMMNNGASADLNKVRFVDRQNGWAVGEGGAIYRSTNGGASWSSVLSGTLHGLEGLALQGGNVVSVGLYGDILRSVNGSAFSMITAGTRSSINAVTAAIPSSAWAVTSDGGILASTDGGRSWQPRSSSNTQPLYGIDNINGQILVACGNGGVILRSTDAGMSWNTVPSGTTVALSGVELLSNDTGYIVGSSGRILKTTNAGAGWYAVASGTLESLFGVHFVDAGHGTVVGSAGKVFSTTNGGYTWMHQQSWTQDALFHVLRDGNRGMLCGDDGTVSYTTDGGVSWTDCLTGTTAALFHLSHPAPNEYAAVGENGTIMRSSDFGQTWVREISHAQHTLYGADAHGGNVYVVGDYGTALRNGSYPYPVELRLFTVQRDGDCALLRWKSEREIALFGYAVERRVGDHWVDVAFVHAGQQQYTWRDCTVAVTGKSWRLKMLDLDGSWEYSPEVSLEANAQPTSWKVDVYPQPARSSVHVRLPSGVRAVEVYDMQGRRIHAASADGERVLTVAGEIFPVSGHYLLLLRGRSRIIAKTFQVLK